MCLVSQQQKLYLLLRAPVELSTLLTRIRGSYWSARDSNCPTGIVLNRRDHIEATKLHKPWTSQLEPPQTSHTKPTMKNRVNLKVEKPNSLNQRHSLRRTEKLPRDRDLSPTHYLTCIWTLISSG